MSLLKHNPIGITINDHAIEVVELGKRGKKVVVKNSGHLQLKEGIVSGNHIKNKDALREALVQTFAQAQPKTIDLQDSVVALPHAYGYSHSMVVPKGDKASYEKAIAQALPNVVPLEPEDILFSYTVIAQQPVAKTKKKKKEDVLLLIIATSKAVLTSWHTFFKSMKIDATFDFSALALYRALVTPDNAGTVCVVDMSDQLVTIALFNNNVLQYSFGRHFTQSDTVVATVSKEITALITHAQQTNGLAPQAVVLVAPLGDKGAVAKQLSKQIGIPVVNATSKITNDTARLVTAGLALRTLDTQWDKTDPLIAVQKAQALQPLIEQYNLDASEEQPESEEDLEEVIAAKHEAQRLKKQKGTLIALVLLGVIALGIAYWYRSNQRAQHEQQLAEQTTQYTQTQSFDLTVPIAVQEEDQNEQRVTGRIATITIQGSGGYDEALSNAKRLAEKEIVEGEFLWESSINEPADKTSVTFPLDIQWLIYSKTEADQLLLHQVAERNTSSVSYALNQIIITGIQTPESDELYTLQATVTVSLNELIATTTPTPDTASEEGEEDDGTQRAVILETTTGFLNVRSGPGTSFDQIGRASPSDEFVIVDSSDDWYQIQFTQDKTGWVFSEYIQLK